MGKSLSEYAAQHPQEQPTEERAQTATTADIIRERQEEQAEADRLKEIIARQIAKGEAPQAILYAALKAIGILSHDAAWTEATTAALDSVWADLAQQSMFTNAEAIAADRLREQQQAYIDKLRRQTERQLAGHRKLERALQDILNAADEIAPED